MAITPFDNNSEAGLGLPFYLRITRSEQAQFQGSKAPAWHGYAMGLNRTLANL
jgi:hypothetical protein